MSTINQNKAYFMLPGFCEHFNLYKEMNYFFQKYPEAKRENAEIYCYYGNIPFCSWDGGRVFFSYQSYTIEEIYNIAEYYNTYLQSKIRLIFTNNLIQEHHCFERYNNIVTEIFHNENNEITVNSNVLEDYLIKNYPKYKMISSTTKCLTKTDEAEKELKQSQYSFICLDYNLNKNWNFLNSLESELKEKVELLVNPICDEGCPCRKEHYRLNSLFSLNYGKPYTLKNCKISLGALYPNKNRNVITADEIYNKYLNSGFQYFKIEGRTHSSYEVAIQISDYLIKPEYQKFFLNEIYLQLKNYN